MALTVILFYATSHVLSLQCAIYIHCIEFCYHIVFVYYLGNIPLRHLVYRVLDLPLSMRPLLYDFGQVIGKTEDEYIRQIVTNHVCLFNFIINHYCTMVAYTYMCVLLNWILCRFKKIK